MLEWIVASSSKVIYAGYVEKFPKEFLEEIFMLLLGHEETGRLEDAQEFADRIRAKLLPERS